MQRLQELNYNQDRDYRVGSPHLSHAHLYNMLLGNLRQAVVELHQAGLPLSVLDVGAGSGGFTEPLLASGCRVLATEMSRASLERLQWMYGLNQNFRCVLDDGGTLEALGQERFSLVLCSSVLHHIPDYMTFVTGTALDHLAVRGCFMSFQDPLWYPTLTPLTHRLDRAAYLLWRIPRGDYRRGMATLWRRMTGTMSATEPSDMVEYHVVRQGVDQNALSTALKERFVDVTVDPYWSTPSSVLQAVGDRIGRPNTFMVRARQFIG